jgi:hypothetical protein
MAKLCFDCIDQYMGDCTKSSGPIKGGWKGMGPWFEMKDHADTVSSITGPWSEMKDHADTVSSIAMLV